MGGFLVFAGIIGALVLFFRYLRSREVEAFKGQDMSVLKDFSPSNPKAGVEPGPIVDVEKLATLYPDLVNSAPGVIVPEYILKDSVLDEIHRNVLGILERLLPPTFGIFVQMPLTNFVRLDGGSAELYGKSVSFLVCEKPAYRVAFAITLRGAGASEMENHRFLTSVFSRIGKPLITLPMVSGISEQEVGEQIDALELG